MYRFAVIGGGLVGLGTARALRNQYPTADVVLLEKEGRTGEHQSTHNSGVLHAGLYYKPGSLKARLAVAGIRQMKAFCAAHGVAHEECGKLVIATNEEEVGRLKTLVERGEANGLRGLRWLDQAGLRSIEPHAAGIAAVHVPEEGIVDYRGVCDVLHQTLSEAGVEIRLNSGVQGIEPDGKGWLLKTATGPVSADFIINCAGLHCDRIAEAAGEARSAKIVPFRGEYYQLKPSAASLVKHLIYPVPDPSFPFLGVHFTRMIHGGVEAGPNAVLAYSREGYTKWTVNARDLVEAASYRGLWAFMKKHRHMAWEEVKRSFSKKLFCASLQRLVPAITEDDLVPGAAGVRAQAMLDDGTLIQDFHLVERFNAIHVLNAPSPGATASLAIGEHIVSKVNVNLPAAASCIRSGKTASVA